MGKMALVLPEIEQKFKEFQNWMAFIHLILNYATESTTPHRAAKWQNLLEL